MSRETLHWSYDGQDIELGLDRIGRGPLVLLLPALSSISTRHEMRPLQERLAYSFATVSVDWPGFGDLQRPKVDWRPEIYDSYLDYLLDDVVGSPFAIIAAGHGAGYVLRHFAKETSLQSRLVLLSPTWRGPLPTMTEGYRAIYPKLPKLIDLPVLGSTIYALNVNRLVISLMADGHVYSEPGWLRDGVMREKLAVTRAPGARHASSRFVTGCLDPFTSRAEQLQAVQAIASPILNLFADETPVRSRREMEELAELSNLQTYRLGYGKLSFYEEFPDDAIGPIRRFLV